MKAPLRAPATADQPAAPSRPRRPSVSVVICAYTLDRWDDLRDAIGSLDEQTRPADEVILVIDHNPHLKGRAESRFPHVRVIENTGPRGVAGGRNSGVAVATGEVVAFLDDDAVADPGWLAALLEPYRDPTVAAVGGASFGAWDKGHPRWLAPEFDWIVGCNHPGLPRTTADVRNVWGCNMSLRRWVFDTVGNFHTALGRVGTVGLGAEETDLFIRLHQRMPDARVLYEPAAIVVQRIPEARGTVRYFVNRCWGEGLSKAHLAERNGQKDSLATERSYVTRTLPVGMAKHLRAAMVDGDLAGVGRAASIVGGLTVTAAGYARGRLGGHTLPTEPPNEPQLATELGTATSEPVAPEPMSA